MTAESRDTDPIEKLRVTAPALRRAWEVATEWLATNREGINAINVYPVPDGDTGTNMLLTLRSALKDVPFDSPHLGNMAAQISRAALLGARGNSGVITSQMLRGLAEALEGMEETDGTGLGRALVSAADTAYAAVSQPVEGTMLTVLRDTGNAVQDAITRAAPPEETLRIMISEAYASVERTPTLLPRLAEAGVVDSGGAGIAVILEGLASGLAGIPLPTQPRFADTEQLVLTDAVEHEGHGYCTEFIVLAPPDASDIDRASMEQRLISLGGESVLVVGDDRTAHIHVHMEDPGSAISLGAQSGALISVKVENMQAQHEEWMATHTGENQTTSPISPVSTTMPVVPPRPMPDIGLVAVAHGPGIASAFLDLSASGLVDAASGARPSAGELLEACRAAGRKHVILLPNDKDIIMAANTCAEASDGFVTVIPTRNAAAGLAAAVYYLPTGDPQSIADEMTQGLRELHYIEVTHSVRDCTVDGVTVANGDAIAFVDGQLIAATDSLDHALTAALVRSTRESAEIITIYLGADAPAGAKEHLPELIEATCPGLEVEILPGGQPHYPYLASVE